MSSLDRGWRSEARRATLWFVPSALVAVAIAAFGVTYLLDRLAFDHHFVFAGWVSSGSADAGRQIMTAIAAAVITVAGVVFSITIVAFTLASSQFGPRILRNFIRDRGTQFTLGTFVATFAFDVLTLGAISSHVARPDFVPHLSITVALALLMVDLVVLIYFIHHVTRSIQLPEVMAGIGRDLQGAIDELRRVPDELVSGLSPAETSIRLAEDGADVRAGASGYLQYIRYGDLIDIATRSSSVIELYRRPGQFVVAHQAIARVWPASNSSIIEDELARLHVVGSVRTPLQDAVFAIDQLVEIAIRALSPAVNDTFTSLTCIDWLGAGLIRIDSDQVGEGIHRDHFGVIRVIDAPLTYEELVKAAFDKIRQAGRGMPAVFIRQLRTLALLAATTPVAADQDVLRSHADMILRAAEESVAEASDLIDIRDRYTRVAEACTASP